MEEVRRKRGGRRCGSTAAPSVYRLALVRGVPDVPPARPAADQGAELVGVAHPVAPPAAAVESETVDQKVVVEVGRWDPFFAVRNVVGTHRIVTLFLLPT